jgi:hypothetical protein
VGLLTTRSKLVREVGCGRRKADRRRRGDEEYVAICDRRPGIDIAPAVFISRAVGRFQLSFHRLSRFPISPLGFVFSPAGNGLSSQARPLRLQKVHGKRGLAAGN